MFALVWLTFRAYHKARKVATHRHSIHNIIFLYFFSRLIRLFAFVDWPKPIESHLLRIRFSVRVQILLLLLFLRSFRFWGQANRWFLCEFHKYSRSHSISATFFSSCFWPIEIGGACFAHRIAKNDMFTWISNKKRKSQNAACVSIAPAHKKGQHKKNTQAQRRNRHFFLFGVNKSTSKFGKIKLDSFNGHFMRIKILWP